MINRISKINKIVTVGILVTFNSLPLSLYSPTNVQAQEITANQESVQDLPEVGKMVNLSGSYKAPIMQGIKIFPDNPLKFDFIMNLGESQLGQEALQQKASELIKYFLASLTVPEENMWVNLSPYEKDRIIPEEFGYTQMGRDLLKQDYLLKQITASLLYPEGELGSAFWEKVYQKAHDKYGQVELPVDTFNKVWVIPDKAVVFEDQQTAFVVESQLKVMLESDYLAMKHNSARVDQQQNAFTTEILKEIIIPEIQKEVNHGKNFALLREIYNSMILATWFKQNLKESVLGRVYVGKNKITGVEVEDNAIKEKIYRQYLESFKKGVYNYIKEEYEPSSQQIIPRKYFSGGVQMIFDVDHAMVTTRDKKTLEAFSKDPLLSVSANMIPEKEDSLVNASIERANTFAKRLSEIYQFSRKPLVIRYALQSIGDFDIDVEKEFRSYPDIAQWIISMREEFKDFIPFGGQFAVSPQSRPMDVLFTKTGDAILVAGQGQTGKGSLIKALNEIGWKDSLNVGSEDYTILFYAGGHVFAATYNDSQNDVRIESSVLNDNGSLLKAKFQARAFDSNDFVDVSWAYRVGRVNCIINLEKYKRSSFYREDNVINIYKNVMADNTDAFPETVSIIPTKGIPLKAPIKIVTIAHDVSTADQYRNMAKRIYENITEANLATEAQDIYDKKFMDLKAASGAAEEDDEKTKLNKKSFSSASVFGSGQRKQEDEYVQVEINLDRDISNAKGRFMAVMDGHGGKRTALLVKERIVSYFKNALVQTDGKIESAFKLLVQELNRATQNERSGTTLSAAYLPEGTDKVYIVVLGDSPVIVKEKGGKINYGPMHNVRLSPEERSAAEKRGAVFEEGYLVKRLEGQGTAALELTRSLGDTLFSQELNREPDVYSLELDADSFILIGSDGLFDPSLDEVDQEARKMVRLLEEGANAQNILNDAIVRDTKDNITALVMTQAKEQLLEDPKKTANQMIERWKGWTPSGNITQAREIIKDKNELFAAVLARVIPAAIIPLNYNDRIQNEFMAQALNYLGMDEVNNHGLGYDLIVGKEDYVREIVKMLEDKFAGKIFVDEAYKRKIGEYLGYSPEAVDIFLSASEGFYKNEKELISLGWNYLGDFVAFPQNDNRYLSKAWGLGNYVIAVDGDSLILGPNQLPWQEEKIRRVSMDEIKMLSAQIGETQGDEDFALSVDTPEERNVGGIDLNPNNLNLQTTGKPISFEGSFDFNNLVSSSINGFSPVILEMKPIANLPLTLGLTQ